MKGVTILFARGITSMQDLYYAWDRETGHVEAVDLMTWARWFDKPASRRLLHDEPAPGVRVSTVFLGLDHNFSQSGPPVLWETMIFGGPHDGHQARYTSEADARAGHAAALEMARAG
jgi:hypothetical protein